MCKLTIEQIKEKITEHNNKVIELSLNGEFKGSKPELYTEKPYSLPSYQPMQIGVQTILNATKQLQKMLPMGVEYYKLETVEIFFSGNLVVEIGTYEMTVKVPHVQEPMSDKGKYMNVFEITESGDLRIKAETWNTDTPPSH